MNEMRLTDAMVEAMTDLRWDMEDIVDGQGRYVDLEQIEAMARSLQAARKKLRELRAERLAATMNEIRAMEAQ